MLQIFSQRFFGKDLTGKGLPLMLSLAETGQSHEDHHEEMSLSDSYHNLCHWRDCVLSPLLDPPPTITLSTHEMLSERRVERYRSIINVDDSRSVVRKRVVRSLSTRCEGYIGGYIMKSCIKDLVALHFVYLLWAGNLYIIMSDSEHSTVTYTSVSEDDSDIGSPGVDGPPIMPEDPYAYIMAAYGVPPSPDYIPGPEVPPSPDYIPGPEGPPSPDYVPGPEEPEQAPPSPVYLPYVPEPVYPEYIPPEDDVFLAEEQPLHVATSPTTESPGYIPESDLEEDPEEDPADYPADRDDDDEEEEEEEHPAPADSVPPVHRMTARISIRDEPSISLPPRLPQIPSPPPNSPTHIEILESCLPLQKRVRFASPTPSREVGESSAAGAARQDRPTIAREDLYGFVDMVDVPPRCSTSRELDYGITDTWDDLVGAIDEIAPTTLEGVNQRVTDLATIVEQETTIMYGIIEDAQDDQSQLRGRV
ncbi:hypothetical protein Tco_0287045, partial [Tanacetum coccineum]